MSRWSTQITRRIRLTVLACILLAVGSSTPQIQSRSVQGAGDIGEVEITWLKRINKVWVKLRRNDELANIAVDMKDFTTPMSFRNTLRTLYIQSAGVLKQKRILVHKEQFLLENPELDIFDVNIRFAEFPKKPNFAQFLRLTLAQIPKPYATYVCRVDYIEINTLQEVQKEWRADLFELFRRWPPLPLTIAEPSADK